MQHSRLVPGRSEDVKLVACLSRISWWILTTVGLLVAIQGSGAISSLIGQRDMVEEPTVVTYLLGSERSFMSGLVYGYRLGEHGLKHDFLYPTGLQKVARNPIVIFVVLYGNG